MTTSLIASVVPPCQLVNVFSVRGNLEVGRADERSVDRVRNVAPDAAQTATYSLWMREDIASCGCVLSLLQSFILGHSLPNHQYHQVSCLRQLID